MKFDVVNREFLKRMSMQNEAQGRRNAAEALEDNRESGPCLDKVRGCLVGGAAGDALGYPVEFMDEMQILSRFGDDGITEYQLDSKTGKARISDDTQMTLFTATGCLAASAHDASGGALLGYNGIDDKWKRNLELSDVVLEVADDICRV